MKAKVKTVYYCDFCRKHSLRPLIEHEKSCTGNPDRHCKMCEQTRERIRSIARLFRLQNFRKTNHELIDYTNAYDRVDGCPACMLTVIRLSGLNKFPYRLQFDYKKEVEEYWKERNEEERRSDFDAEVYADIMRH